MSTLKALSALLSYPSEEMVRALPEITQLLGQDKRLARHDREALADLIGELMATDLLDVQEHYVDLFDRGRATALHLFEHVHGESRDRGQAMVDLIQIYERGGFALTTHELPDYLPAMLEYLSYRPTSDMKEMLGDCAHILRAVGETLQSRDSRYSAIFGALLSLVGEPKLSPVTRREIEVDKSLDEEWAETPAFDGAACSASRPPKKSVIQIVKRAA
ncbi:MAG TPA: nitrate reductase molybdenum cofactor assembly chaperone [Burkholderiales bacterium]|nr:nitrate reductase molybdenum cofactor assembly chaperone [Burkholderiales bacterium]